MKPLTLTVCLILCLLTLASGVNAQENLNFANLPLVNTPTPVPIGYGQLTWSNFFYVNPFGWSGAGSGYQLGSQGQDVAFIGGEFCRLSGDSCFGTLSDIRGFVAVGAHMAGGFGPAQITVMAYDNGHYVGSANYFLTTQMRAITFPVSWGAVSQLVVQVNGPVGDLVIYDLSLYTLGG